MKLNKIKRYILIFTTLIFPILALLIQGCSPCVDCLDKKNDVTKENLGKLINSTVDDFAPYLVDENTLLFTSNRGGGQYSKINESSQYGEDLFSSKLKDGKWQSAELYGTDITTEKNEGTFTKELKKVIVARSYDDKGFGGSDLYEADMVNSQIMNLKNLGSKINSSRWEAHPTVSPDGNVLIFASDRPGGKGGSDLYKSIKLKDGSWSEPVQLKELNTPGNEYSPHIAADGLTLFFASDGRKDTYGNLDIYVASLVDFSQVKHLEAPINSNFNDVFPFLKQSGCKKIDTLYYSSDRPGGCGGLDLYASPYKPPTYIIAAVVKDKVTGQPLKVNSQVVFNSKSDNTSENISVTAPTSKFERDVCTGSYLMTASAPGYFPGSAEVDVTFNISDKTYNKDIFLQPHPALTLEGEIKDKCGKLPFETEVMLVNAETNQVIQTKSTVDSRYEFKVPFSEGAQRFEIKVNSTDYMSKEQTFVNIPAGLKENETFRNDIYVELIPINPAQIPYFITGYYKLNTSENLSELRNNWASKYKKLEYIENPNKKIFDPEAGEYRTYDDFAKDVDEFVEGFKKKMFDTVLPRFERILEKSPNSRLEILIEGYVDQREFFGKYIEDLPAVVDNPKTINKGDNIMNRQLSMLRAFYMSEFIKENIFEQGSKYADLLNSGKVLIKKYGRDVYKRVDKKLSNEFEYLLAQYRHIKVFVQIVDPNRCK